MAESNTNTITEDRVRLMISESIESYHKENLLRFDRLIEKVETVVALIHTVRGIFYTVAACAGIPALVYYLIKIVQEIKK